MNYLQGSGRFYTPKRIVNTMVNILDMEKNSSVYNPACFSGDFIIESLRDKGKDIYAFGEEENISNYNICMTNLFLHNIKNARISENGLSEIPKVDYAIANPPFELYGKGDIKLTDAMYDEYGVTSNTSTYVKFIIKMLNNIGPRGKMSIVLPQGFLFKQNTVEKNLRKKLIENRYIDAIIMLPEKMFDTTKIPVIVLVVNKQKKNRDVLFIDASHEYKAKRKTNSLTEENQRKIIDTYMRREVIKNYSCRVALEEIKENDYNLNINNYMTHQKEKVNMDCTEKEIIVWKLEDKRARIQCEIRQAIKEIKGGK